MSIPYQKQYADITKRILNNPNKVGDSRIGKINSRFCEQIRVDLSKEFPLQNIKSIKPSNIIHELLWMINGNTNIKYLIENKCNIWTDDAYRYYIDKFASKFNTILDFGDKNFTLPVTKEEFIDFILDEIVIRYEEDGEDKVYTFGDLDRVYGYQWRKLNGKTDQLQKCIDTLLTNPDDRRMIVSSHNLTDIEEDMVGLPSCHNYFQFYTVDNGNGTRSLSTFVNIRSNDFGLGNPYNVAQYALLTHIVANIVGMVVCELVINSVDCHIYHSHFEGMKEWLDRYNEHLINNYNTIKADDWYGVLGSNAKISFTRKLTSIDDIKYEDIEISNYNPKGYIKMKLLT